MQKICDECKVSKDLSGFRQSPVGTYYDRCSVCFLASWRANQIEFWSDKKTRKCFTCKDVVQLTEYARDAHGIPFRDCQACFRKRYAKPPKGPVGEPVKRPKHHHRSHKKESEDDGAQ